MVLFTAAKLNLHVQSIFSGKLLCWSDRVGELTQITLRKIVIYGSQILFWMANQDIRDSLFIITWRKIKSWSDLLLSGINCIWYKRVTNRLWQCLKDCCFRLKRRQFGFHVKRSRENFFSPRCLKSLPLKIKLLFTARNKCPIELPN